MMLLTCLVQKFQRFSKLHSVNQYTIVPMGPFATFHRHPAPGRQESCRDVSWMNWSQWPWPPRRVPRSASSRTCGWSSNVASWPLGLGDLSLGRFRRPCRRGLGKDVGKTSRIRVETSFFFETCCFYSCIFCVG